jgi:hypothetical protein
VAARRTEGEDLVAAPRQQNRLAAHMTGKHAAIGEAAERNPER